MYWKDEGYLLSKNNFNENSIIIETFTLEHGKYTGIVYGGTSRKQKLAALAITYFTGGRNEKMVKINNLKKELKDIFLTVNSTLGMHKMFKDNYTTDSVVELADAEKSKDKD